MRATHASALPTSYPNGITRDRTSADRTLNLGVLAHVDAGKTTLTERLLHLAGVVDEPGSVDAGTTRTDSLALERRRGITIKAAVVSFPLRGRDGQRRRHPRPPRLHRRGRARPRACSTRRAGAVGRGGRAAADPDPVPRAAAAAACRRCCSSTRSTGPGRRWTGCVAAIRSRLTPDVLPMGGVAGAGSRTARFVAVPAPTTSASGSGRRSRWPSTTTGCWRRTSRGGRRSPAELGRGLAAQTRAGVLHPVFAGSRDHRCRGAGADGGDRRPAARHRAVTRTAASPSGRVFKVERGQAGEKLAYVRMFAGELRVRQRIELPEGRAGKVGRTGGPRAGSVGADGRGWRAGQVGRVLRPRRGPGRRRLRRRRPRRAAPLPAAHAGGVGGGAASRRRARRCGRPWSSSPTRTRSSTSAPTTDGRATVSLYGRVQQEVIGSTLAEEHGIEVAFLGRRGAARRAAATRGRGGDPAQHRGEPLPGDDRAADRAGPPGIGSPVRGRRARPATCRCTCSGAPRASSRCDRASTSAAACASGATAGA